MEYQGSLYGKAGGRYFPLKATTDDFHRLENAVRAAKAVLDAQGITAEHPIVGEQYALISEAAKNIK